MVLGIQLFQTSQVDLVLELCDTQVLDFDRVSDRPFKTNRYRREVVSVLDKLQLSATMQCFTFKLNSKRLTIHDLEEEVEVMFANFFGIVKHMQVHLLTRSQRASPWLNLKDFLVENFLLKGLFLAWSARVSPSFHLDL